MQLAHWVGSNSGRLRTASCKSAALTTIPGQIHIHDDQNNRATFSCFTHVPIFTAIPGSIVDVRKLMSQLERSEGARGESEARAGDYLKSLNDLKEASEKHNSVRDKLQVRRMLYS